jgi:hypothetical protein
MYYILYISAATRWLDNSELENILALSRINNAVNYISGILLYGNNNFIQLLEGERENVLFTYEKIKVDPRHADVTIIASGDLSYRCFPDWQMGYRSVSQDNQAALDDFIKEAIRATGKNDCELPVRLLQSFVRKMKR